MSEYPLVACICLDPGGRPDFTDRVQRCMDSQSYIVKVKIIRDTRVPQETIGMWRNYAISGATSLFSQVEIIAHFDWDDLSAPDRLSHQLGHIQKTGKLVTGYYDMPMYDVTNDKVWIYSDPAKRYILGTSLFYKREAWERVKFPDRTPEDNLWRKQVGGENCEPQSVFRDGVPMMVQTVHGGNASARISLNPKGIPTSKRFREPSEAEEKAVRELLRA